MGNFIWSIIGWVWFLVSILISLCSGALLAIYTTNPVAGVVGAVIALLPCVYVLSLLEDHLKSRLTTLK